MKITAAVNAIHILLLLFYCLWYVWYGYVLGNAATAQIQGLQFVLEHKVSVYEFQSIFFPCPCGFLPGSLVSFPPPKNTVAD